VRRCGPFCGPSIYFLELKSPGFSKDFWVRSACAIEPIDDFDLPDDICIELVELFGWNPIFLMYSSGADNLDVVLSQIFRAGMKPRDVANVAGCGIYDLAGLCG
jgi:hypothetical protein